LFYSAAAVSDFFLQQMAEHKIQSSAGPLILHLDCTPKLVPLLKSIWIPHCFVVTFKLETDDTILDSKVGVHLFKYNVDVNVGNILGRHRSQVIVYQRNVEKVVINRTEEQEKNGIELEEDLVKDLAQRHEIFLK